MPSLVTSIIGGIQGASAAHNAADAMQKGYTQAGQTVTQAAQQVNPEILAAAKAAGIDVTGAAQTAGQGATTAADKLVSLLSPYMEGGSQAMSNLTAAMGPGGTMNQPFTADMMAQYSPAYAFQLKAGQDAIKARAAASGLGGSGGTAKALGRYAMDYSTNAFGTAASLYNQQQQGIYNRLAGLAGMGMGAATTAGQAGLGAAEYAGTLGTQAAQWAGGADIGAENTAASNTLSAANYLANTQVESQKALAQGTLGAAQAWNSMLGGIGQAGNTIAFGGMSPTGGGWSLSNIGTNLFGGGASSPMASPASMGGGVMGGSPGWSMPTAPYVNPWAGIGSSVTPAMSAAGIGAMPAGPGAYGG
jgi:hypothetical protein